MNAWSAEAYDNDATRARTAEILTLPDATIRAPYERWATPNRTPWRAALDAVRWRVVRWANLGRSRHRTARALELA